ncbi:MAG: aminopeptidase [Erysipelotrichaceae bacterium]|nr:aminopeptidase [Erysipelotrichaceae bacterium]
MVSENVLRKYAKLAVVMGVNVQKGQPLVISADVRDHEFVSYCVEEGYKAGASQVVVEWGSEHDTKWSYEYMSKEDLAEIPDWQYDKRKYAQDKGACFLNVMSSTPGLLKDIDSEKILARQMAASKKFMPLQAYTMANQGQWCIVALPSVGWAKKVFPDKSDDEAVKALWDAILMSVRVSEDNDPIAEWEQHNKEILTHSKQLNDYNFKSLHFTNSLGTDLTVELVENHIWAGGCEEAGNGAIFNPNMPTEENFCMPYKYGVNGKVVATKPLSYQGKLIDGFSLTFKDGKVVEYSAEKELEALKNLVEFDEGSAYLGEVALISYDSPINKTGILFYNTLFDENASCHLALGRAYPMNVKGGTTMSQEELAKAGANGSMTHVDFMFGSRDMHVDGTTHDGEVVAVFRNGNFVL